MSSTIPGEVLANDYLTQLHSLKQQNEKMRKALSNISDIVSLLPIRASYLNDIRRIANAALSSIEGAENRIKS